MMRLRRQTIRGFTLVEVMIVVAIVGVMAMLAMVSYRKFFGAAKENEATAIIQGIRSAEESYRAEAMTYLDVSTSGNFHPQNAAAFSVSTFNSKKWNFVNPAASDHVRWRVLGVTTDGPVAFGYRVRAGGAGTAMTQPSWTIPGWPTGQSGEPWYVVEAIGDPDGDGQPVRFIASSLSGEVFRKD